jgi:hypothetical protein
MKTIVKNKITDETFEYKEPIYTKINGIYGYLCVSQDKVYFMHPDSVSIGINCDELTDYKVKNYV